MGFQMIHKILFMFTILVCMMFSVSCKASQSGAPSEVILPNPASVYCEQQGNKLEIVTATDGSQNGVCVFPDGSACDEWAYFRNECGPEEQGDSPSESTEGLATTPEISSQSTSSIAPSDSPTVTALPHVITNRPLGYCFAYPQGYTQQINGSQAEVIGPQSAPGSNSGLVWIDAADAQGFTALEVANKEVNEFGGAPLRSTVMMDGEEALVLDGMPGQDLIRKVYIVHTGLLYTLSFSPYQSGNDTANSQMEALFESVTSSWVWMSSGKSCPATH